MERRGKKKREARGERRDLVLLLKPKSTKGGQAALGIRGVFFRFTSKFPFQSNSGKMIRPSAIVAIIFCSARAKSSNAMQPCLLSGNDVTVCSMKKG